ncbi:ACP S-malonyltransferase [Clostridium sp.]|uniref:ACP S-malonyltransferase n=1 Tax=Clostridium sp. TaxID=1506 RepID=UPI00321790EC
MSKIAFIFSGQGSQYVGMCKELYSYSDIIRNTFKEATEVLGFSVEDLCFNSSEEELNKTENTQVAMVTMSTSISRLLKSMEIEPTITAGLSLGEYSALVDSGALDFKSAIGLVRKRGMYMTEAVEHGKGAMAAVLGLERDVIEKCLKESQHKGIVEISNLNSPKQIVISGEKHAVEYSSQLLYENGAKKVIPLKVSGPFHSSMMKSASEKLYKDLINIEFRSFHIPVVSNYSAEYFRKDNIVENLKMQVMSSVLWEDSINLMIDKGIDTFIEIGPKNTLSAFVKKINRDVATYNVEDLASLERLSKGLSLEK